MCAMASVYGTQLFHCTGHFSEFAGLHYTAGEPCPTCCVVIQSLAVGSIAATHADGNCIMVQSQRPQGPAHLMSWKALLLYSCTCSSVLRCWLH